MDNFLFLPRSLVSAFFDLAFAAAVGCLVATILLRPDDQPNENPPTSRNTLRRTIIVAAFAIAILLAAQICLTTATMIGTSSSAQVRAQFFDVATGTHAGRVLIAQLTFALALLLVVSIRRLNTHPYGTKLALCLCLGLTAVRAASGHAAGHGDFTLPEAVQFLHLSSIALWAGGVMIAGFIVIPSLQQASSPQALSHFAARLSVTSTWAVGIVVATGIYNGWTGLGGSLNALPHTQWAILLTIKSAIVFLALAIGAKNRLLLRRNDLEAEATDFSRWLRAEAVLMVAILLLSGFLANSPPATDM